MAKKQPDVETVKRLIAEGKTVEEIAAAYNVCTSTVHNRISEADTRERVKSMIPVAPVKLKEPKKNALAKNVERDEKVSKFVDYHMELIKMRQGVDKRNVTDLYQRFYNYLAFCRDRGIVPNNMNAYFAIGVDRHEITHWKHGDYGTPEHRAFAETITSFFASIHEQGATDGVMNPISAMFWQKTHDGMVEASKVEVIQQDPLGDRKSAEEIAAKYADVVLPD